MLLDAHVPASRLLQAAADAASSDQKKRLPTLRKNLQERLYTHAKTDTPYGLVVKHADIFDNGNRLTIQYACPFAMLYRAASISKVFANFLRTCLEGGTTGTVILNNDKTTPGNQNRPDKGRGYEAIYWSLLEFPPWLLERLGAAGWIAFAYVLSVDLDSSGVSVPALIKGTMQIFWSAVNASFNFATTGMRIQCGDAWIHIRLNFGCFLADCLAHDGITSTKGASGKKPCLECMNCRGRCAPSRVEEGLVHFTDPDFSKFVPHTPATFKEMAVQLSELVANGHRETVFRFFSVCVCVCVCWWW
jgi:hypothetical protein